MTADQLTGKYMRLRSELEQAYAEPDWSTCRGGHIDRIAAELAEIERAISKAPVRDEQSADSLLGYLG